MTEHIKIKRFDTKYGNNNLILFSSPNNLLNGSGNSGGSNNSGSSRKSSHGGGGGGGGGVDDDGNRIENLISNEQKLKLEKLKWHDNNIKLMSKSSSTSAMKTSTMASKRSAMNKNTTNTNNGKMIVKEKENHFNTSHDSGSSRFQRSHSTNNIHNNNNQANNNKAKLFVHTVETVVERNKKATEWLHQEQNDVS